MVSIDWMLFDDRISRCNLAVKIVVQTNGLESREVEEGTNDL